MKKNFLGKLFTAHKRDILLGTVLLLVALCLFFVFRIAFSQKGKTVTVRHDNRVIATYSLDEDGTYPFKDLYGENTLVIQNGQVTMTDASCSDKICEKMGPISQVGQMIICLPNELFVTITSEEEEGEVDAVLQ